MKSGPQVGAFYEGELERQEASMWRMKIGSRRRAHGGVTARLFFEALQVCTARICMYIYYIFIFIYLSVYIYIYIYTCIYIYTYTYIHIYIYTRICIYTYIYHSTYVWNSTYTAAASRRRRTPRRPSRRVLQIRPSASR